MQANLRYGIAIVAEAGRAVRAHLIGTVATATLVAALVASILVLVGESASAEDRVMGHIDAAGTRTITIRVSAAAALSTQFLVALSRTREVEQVIGLGPITDARPATHRDGPAIAVRTLYDPLGSEHPQLSDLPHNVRRGLASTKTISQAGFVQGTGTLVQDDHGIVEVVGTFTLSDDLRFLEPVVVLPRAIPTVHSSANAPLVLILVRTRLPSQVRGVEALARNLLAAEGSTSATVETSSQLAAVRMMVSGELGSYQRFVVATALLVGVGLVSISVFMSTNRYRKDFGRRRALGARRSLIAFLVLAEAAIPALIGAAAGAAGTLAIQAALRLPTAPPSFVISLFVAAMAATLLAALAPAVVAAWRDPLIELRVP